MVAMHQQETQIQGKTNTSVASKNLVGMVTIPQQPQVQNVKQSRNYCSKCVVQAKNRIVSIRAPHCQSEAVLESKTVSQVENLKLSPWQLHW